MCVKDPLRSESWLLVISRCWAPPVICVLMWYLRSVSPLVLLWYCLYMILHVHTECVHSRCLHHATPNTWQGLVTGYEAESGRGMEPRMLLYFKAYSVSHSFQLAGRTTSTLPERL